MGSDIQFVAFRAVGDCLQVIVSNGVAVLISHEVGELFRFPVEEVQSAAFGTDPDVVVFVFYHFADERIVQAIVSGVVGGVDREKVRLRVEIVNPAIIGPQPDRSLPVFVKRENGRMGHAAGQRGTGINFEPVTGRIVFIQSGEGPDPDVPEIVFRKIPYLVA